jgi:hypothetical protein
VPARSDLYTICLELARRVGIPSSSVWRGFFLPAELEWGPEKYPAMGFRPLREQIVSGNAGYTCSGLVNLDFWLYTGREGPAAIANDPLCLKPLDDIHDTLLDHLSDSYPELHAQTISIYPDEAEGWTPWEYLESPHAGASMRLKYDLLYGPKAH